MQQEYKKTRNPRGLSYKDVILGSYITNFELE